MSARHRMDPVPELFTNPNLRQQAAIESLNLALGLLAVSYGLNEDDLNEAAGAAVEQAVVDQTIKIMIEGLAQDD